MGNAAAVLHLATAIPATARTTPADWVTNDRLRRKGTRNLVEACKGRENRAFVQQSVAYVYGEWLDEETPPRPIVLTLSAVDAERIVLEAYQQWGLPAIVLRGATFYHPESWHTRYFVEQLKRRMLPVIGDGKTYWHYIHADDMALSIVCAVENAENAADEIFFVADDQPFQTREFLNCLADRLGAPRPMQVLVWLARMFAGSLGVNVLSMSARYKTDKIKKILGWSPRYPTYREGFEDVLARMAHEAQSNDFPGGEKP